MSQLSEPLLQSMPPIPQQKTVLLINNFILSTSRFLNTFSDSYDLMLCRVGGKITEMEVLVGILESKLNSVPEGVVGGGNEPAAEDENKNVNQEEEPGEAQAGEQPQQEQQQAEESTALVDSSTIRACEHPDYAPFFKMLKMGVPEPAVALKAQVAGLDGDVIRGDPDALIKKSEEEE